MGGAQVELQPEDLSAPGHYMSELPEGEDRPHNVLGWMRAMDVVEKRVGAKKLISVFGRCTLTFAHCSAHPEPFISLTPPNEPHKTC